MSHKKDITSNEKQDIVKLLSIGNRYIMIGMDCKKDITSEEKQDIVKSLGDMNTKLEIVLKLSRD